MTQHAMADVLVGQGKIAEAMELYKQALQVYQEVGDVQGIAVTQHAMADVLVGQGKIAEAMELYKQALQVYQEVGDVRGIAVTQGAWRMCWWDRGR